MACAQAWPEKAKVKDDSGKDGSKGEDYGKDLAKDQVSCNQSQIPFHQKKKKIIVMLKGGNCQTKTKPKTNVKNGFNNVKNGVT